MEVLPLLILMCVFAVAGGLALVTCLRRLASIQWKRLRHQWSGGARGGMVIRNESTSMRCRKVPRRRVFGRVAPNAGVKAGRGLGIPTAATQDHRRMALALEMADFGRHDWATCPTNDAGTINVSDRDSETGAGAGDMPASTGQGTLS